MRLLIAIDNNNGRISKLSSHFGRCPYFALYDTKTERLRIIESGLNHSSLDFDPVKFVQKFNPDVLFTKGIGKKAIELFKCSSINLKTGDFHNVSDVIDNISKLKDLNTSCD